MVEQGLVNYIQQNIARGYDINAIKAHLINYGYQPAMVDEAISYIYRAPEVKHVIHFSPSALIAIVLVLVGVGALISAIIYLVPKENTPKQLLDVNIKAQDTNVYPGDIFRFNVELFNLGNLNRYDITLKYEIKDSKTSAILTTKTETVAIETGKSLNAEINIPTNSEVGDYTLETTAKYQEKTATSSIIIRIVKKEAESTCTDGVKNQGEEDIDCGGPCNSCATCSDGIQNQGETGIDCGGPCPKCLECSDNNECTKDLIVDGECKFEDIVPCCGNKKCEDGESSQTCPIDCKTGDMFEGKTIWEKLDLIQQISKNDPQAADKYCSELDDAAFKDQCYANIGGETGNKRFCEKINEERLKDKCYADVAKKIEDSSMCAEISQPSRADSCYMNFVMDYKQYELCDKITNKYLKDSCNLLKTS